MAIAPLTKDLINIIKDVTGQKHHTMFNEKRKTFERRIKFAGVRDVTDNQLSEIALRIGQLHPDKTLAIIDNTYGQANQRNGYFSGLVVRVA